MNEIIKLIIKYKERASEEIFCTIFKYLTPLIKSFCKTIYDNYREDLFQELSMGLFKVINNFHIEKNLLLNYDSFKKRIYDIYHDNELRGNYYVTNFYVTFLEHLKCEIIITEELLQNYYLEYILFCNQNQFIACLNKRFKFIYQDFIRKHRNYFWHEMRFENHPESCVIKISSESSYSYFKNVGFLRSDIKFLQLFIEDGIFLSETGVGKKIGISQQAIYTKKMALRKKYLEQISR